MERVTSRKVRRSAPIFVKACTANAYCKVEVDKRFRAPLLIQDQCQELAGGEIQAAGLISHGPQPEELLQASKLQDNRNTGSPSTSTIDIYNLLQSLHPHKISRSHSFKILQFWRRNSLLDDTSTDIHIP